MSGRAPGSQASAPTTPGGEPPAHDAGAAALHDPGAPDPGAPDPPLPFDGLPRRTVRWILGVAFAGVTLAVLVGALALPERVALRGLHTWNLFHYMVGAKYFDELGYFDLYEGVLLADEDAGGGGGFRRIHRTRDLRTYRLVTRQEALRQAHARQLRARFSAARWAAFQRDLRGLQAHRRARWWADPLMDRGYNPTPVWTLVQTPVLSAVRFDHHRTVLLLSYGQNLLFLLTFVAVWWAFGWRLLVPFVLWVYLYFGNGIRVLGGWFSYDWFFLTVGALALYGRQRPLGAGLLLALAAMMRGFPGLLALGPAVGAVVSLARGRWPWRGAAGRRRVVFLGALALGCGVLFGATLLQQGGLERWRAWRQKITLHASQHALSPPRVGLRQVFAHDYALGARNLSDAERQRLIARQAPAYYATAGLLALLLLAAMIRRGDHDRFLLCLGLVFAAVLTSRYYWTLGALLMTWVALDERAWVRRLSVGYLFGLLVLFAVQWLTWRGNVWLRWHTFSWGLLLYFGAVSVRFLWQDVRGWRRGHHGPPEGGARLAEESSRG